MASSFYHDSIDAPQKVKGHIVVSEKEDISTTSSLDEVGTIVLHDGELYVYTASLTYEKLGSGFSGTYYLT